MDPQTTTDAVVGVDNTPILHWIPVAITKLPYFNHFPVEVRTMIWDANIYGDKRIANPRIIPLDLPWNPEEDWADDIRHVYYDHDNFKFEITDTTSLVASHRPLLPFLYACKESHAAVQRFLGKERPTGNKRFHSPGLRGLGISPSTDIFYMVKPMIWEAVQEWTDKFLDAAYDVDLMRNFMVDYADFYGLVNPDERCCNEDLVALTDMTGWAARGIQQPHSAANVLKYAVGVFVVASAARGRFVSWKDVRIREEEHVVNKAVPGMSEGERDTLEALWRGEKKDWNEIHFYSVANVPKVSYVSLE